MKKILFLLAMCFCLLSCKSDMDKANEIIKQYMFEHLYDYNSYQPISSEWEIEGSFVKHKFRCKSAGGISKIETWTFFIILEENRVSYVKDEDGNYM